MSDIAKWGILVAAVVSIIVVVLTFPFVQYLPTGAQTLASEIDVIIFNCNNFFYNARALINCFLSPVGRNILTGLISYFFTSWIVKLTIKISAWIFHFIFK